jgi:hypothetical protein
MANYELTQSGELNVAMPVVEEQLGVIALTRPDVITGNPLDLVVPGSQDLGDAISFMPGGGNPRPAEEL